MAARTSVKTVAAVAAWRYYDLTSAFLMLAAAIVGSSAARADAPPYRAEVGWAIRYAAPAADTLKVCRPVVKRGQWAGPFPAVMLIHGGGWSSGSNAIGPGYTGYSGSWCRLWASWGFVAFSIGYRLQDGSSYNAWPAQLVDVQAAVRYVRDHADELGINSGMIGALGDSAGASLAYQLGMMRSTVPGDFAGDHPHTNPQTQFTVAAFGPWSWGPHSAAAPLPAELMQPSTADTLIIQGDRDTTVLPSESNAAFCTFKRAGRPVHYLTYSGGHAYTGFPGRRWAPIVYGLQVRAISFAYAHGHYARNGRAPIIPRWMAGPRLSFDADIPACR